MPPSNDPADLPAVSDDSASELDMSAEETDLQDPDPTSTPLLLSTQPSVSDSALSPVLDASLPPNGRRPAVIQDPIPTRVPTQPTIFSGKSDNKRVPTEDDPENSGKSASRSHKHKKRR